MVAFPLRQRLTPGLAAGLAPGLAIAVTGFLIGMMMFLPVALLEQAVRASGLPAIFPAAEPPLGQTARIALAVTLGSGAGGIVWFAVTLMLPRAPHLFALPAPLDMAPAAVPALRRADVHPDAPARAPLRAARDLGTPFDDAPVRPPVERALPRDLDAPLAAFDPRAIPATPAAPIPLVAPLARPAPALARGERLDVFELPTPITAPRTEATIQALLERLEAGVGRRQRPLGTPLDQTLGELRRLARG